MNSSQNPEAPSRERCPQCHKRTALCVCAELRPLVSRHRVLILQHPQEPDKDLGSARLTELSLPESAQLKIGLSWRNLAHALGLTQADPKRWAVLYLGSGIQGGVPPTSGASARTASQAPLTLVDKKGVPLPDQRALLASLDGIVVLDGTWSQAKTLWWRNAWLLKLRRAILVPSKPSLYKELRREPRSECVSTIESVSLALEALGEPSETTEGLRALFEKLLSQVRSYRRR